jgi:hypothetical protein
MAIAMHNVILKQTMLLIQHARFISITCDEVTTLDNQSWIFVHVYIVKSWCRVPILLNLERIVNGGTSNNLTSVIIRSLAIFDGTSEIDIANKVVCFGADGVTIFQSLKTSVIVQWVSKHCPFVVGIHCMGHWCNLIIQTSSSLTFVEKIEGKLSFMYTYYIQSPKRNLECIKLAKVIKSKGLKIFRNI